MTEARSAQMSVRLNPRQREIYAAAAERFGMDPSTVTRQLIELICQRLTEGEDLIDVLYRIKNALGGPGETVVANDVQPTGAGRFGSTEVLSVEARLARIEAEIAKPKRQGGL